MPSVTSLVGRDYAELLCKSLRRMGHLSAGCPKGHLLEYVISERRLLLKDFCVDGWACRGLWVTAAASTGMGAGWTLNLLTFGWSSSVGDNLLISSSYLPTSWVVRSGDGTQRVRGQESKGPQWKEKSECLVSPPNTKLQCQGSHFYPSRAWMSRAEEPFSTLLMLKVLVLS